MSKKRDSRRKKKRGAPREDGLTKLRRLRQAADAGEEERPDAKLTRIRRDTESERTQANANDELAVKAARIEEAAKRKDAMHLEESSDEDAGFDSKVERLTSKSDGAEEPDENTTKKAKAAKSGKTAARRPTTQPEEETAPSFRKRHDVLVVVSALALVATGTALYRARLRPNLTPYEDSGLRLQRPTGWMAPVTTDLTPSPLVGVGSLEQSAAPSSADGHARLTTFTSSVDPGVRLEVQVGERPRYSNLRRTLGLYRAARYGAFVETESSAQVHLGGRDWSRTNYRYADLAETSRSVRVSSGIEYATINAGRLYVVSLHGTATQAHELEELITPTLEIDANAGEPLEAESSR